MRKPRHVYALHLCQKAFGNIKELQATFDPKAERTHLPSREDIEWLHKFLTDADLKSYLKFLDALTDGPDLTALADRLRPEEQTACDSLRVLSDVWVQLESFVMQTQESEEPEAHELYDLLADPHIREVLVAYDDIANSRYSTAVPDQPLADLSAPPDPDNHSVTNGEDSLGEVTVLSGPPVTHLSENSLGRAAQKPRGRKREDGQGVTDDSRGGAGLQEDQTTYRPGKRVSVWSKSNEVREQSKQPTGISPRGMKKLSMNSPAADVRRPLFADVKDEEEEEFVLEPQRDQAVVHKPPIQSNHRTSPATSPQVAETRPSTRTRDAASPRSSLLSSTRASTQGKTVALASPSGSVRPMSGDAYHQDSGSLRSQRRKELTGDDKASPSRKTTSPSLRRGRDQALQRSLPREPGQVRSVHLRRDHPGESIGITVAVKTPSPPTTPTTTSRLTSRNQQQQPVDSQYDHRQSVLVIQRVITGSLADRQGGLYPGDFLLEFNGKHVQSLDEVHTMMRQTAGSLECHFVVRSPLVDGLLQPGFQKRLEAQRTKRFIRCFFTYDASRDGLMPAGDIGMSFKPGEVLELVDDHDPNWWQVRSLADTNGRVRLVPSQTLEERRQAFNQEKAQGTSLNKKFKRQVKTFFRAADSSCLRLRADIWSYEEVVPWPPTVVPCLLLLGPTGVGRRNLKVLLASQQPKRFGFPVSDTTDPSASTNNFQILQKAQMEKDVREGAYVEWGQVNGHYYGIRFSAIRKIIDSGRTAVLDCQPQTVHLLHQPEFNPCTIFIGSPDFEVAKQMLQDGLRENLTKNNRSDADLRQMIEESSSSAQQHRHLYSHLLVNSSMQETAEKLCRLVARIERQASWIPASWAYELSLSGAAGGGRGSVLPGGGLSSNFIPGSSSLSALGIHGLPPSRASVIAPSLLSGMSTASPESALRLSRPPGGGGGSGRRGRVSPAVQAPIYERRRRADAYRGRPLSPATIQEQDTPASSVVTNSHNRESRELAPEDVDAVGSDLDTADDDTARRRPKGGEKWARQNSGVGERRRRSAGADAEAVVGRQNIDSRESGPVGRVRLHESPRGSRASSSRGGPSKVRGARSRQVDGGGRDRRREENISSTSSEDDDLAAEEFHL